MTTGKWAYAAGTSGTVTLPVGAILTHVRCESHSATGSVTIFGGSAIPVDGSANNSSHQTFEMQFPTLPDLSAPDSSVYAAVATSGARTVVFTDTVSYFVGYMTR